MVEKVSLNEIIGTENEPKVLAAIAEFSCQDAEVESFLKEKAIEFDKRSKSRTYLLADGDDDEKIVIWGYYTLTLKSLKFNTGLSNSKVKKIDGFRSDVAETESILIGQLGKDYLHREKISGFEIIEYALDDIYAAHRIVGSRIVFLECASNEKVIRFYRDNGFAHLQNSEDGKYLQMIRFL